MKKIIWRTGNRQKIETGCTVFDRQCDGLMTGNVWGGVQFSNYIRAYAETECNGFENPPGHLRKFDLDYFKSLPSHIREAVEKETRTVKGILYEYRHHTSDGCGGHIKHLHGWILTRGDEHDHRMVRIFPANNRWKSQHLLQVVAEYISNPAPVPVQKEV